MWMMSRGWILVVWLGLVVGTPIARGEPDRIIKVLPHYLDLQGRHAVSPSLFERDAYQAMLRQTPAKQGGRQFDIQWKARKRPGRVLQLRLELVTVEHTRGNPFRVDLEVTPTGTFGRWKRIKLEKALTDRLGEIIAWRVTLREDGNELSEQKSFLW